MPQFVFVRYYLFLAIQLALRENSFVRTISMPVQNFHPKFHNNCYSNFSPHFACGLNIT